MHKIFTLFYFENFWVENTFYYAKYSGLSQPSCANNTTDKNADEKNHKKI